MPNYKTRDEMLIDENSQGGAMEILNMYGANKVVPKEEEPKKEVNDLIGGVIDDVMTSKKPHHEMVRKILQMKPKDIHIIKKSAKYFLDNPEELGRNVEVDEGIMNDLSQTLSSNDLADMVDKDYEMSNGGELDGATLLEGFAHLLDAIPKVQKQFN